MQLEIYVTKRLQALCNTHKMTKYRLAKLTGLSQTAISKIFSGKTLPNLYSLSLICDALGITLSQFFSCENSCCDSFSEDQQKLLNLWNELPADKKDLLLKIITVMHDS